MLNGVIDIDASLSVFVLVDDELVEEFDDVDEVEENFLLFGVLLLFSFKATENLGVSFDSVRLDVVEELLEKLEQVEAEPVDEVVQNSFVVLFDCCFDVSIVFGVSLYSLSFDGAIVEAAAEFDSSFML